MSIIPGSDTWTGAALRAVGLVMAAAGIIAGEVWVLRNAPYVFVTFLGLAVLVFLTWFS